MASEVATNLAGVVKVVEEEPAAGQGVKDPPGTGDGDAAQPLPDTAPSDDAASYLQGLNFENLLRLAAVRVLSFLSLESSGLNQVISTWAFFLESSFGLSQREIALLTLAFLSGLVRLLVNSHVDFYWSQLELKMVSTLQGCLLKNLVCFSCPSPSLHYRPPPSLKTANNSPNHSHSPAPELINVVRTDVGIHVHTLKSLIFFLLMPFQVITGLLVFTARFPFSALFPMFVFVFSYTVVTAACLTMEALQRPRVMKAKDLRLSLLIEGALVCGALSSWYLS